MLFLVVLGFMLLFYSFVYLFFFFFILLKESFGESGVIGSEIFSYGSEEKMCLKVGMLFVFLRFDIIFFVGYFL